jgi:TolA-binding protein
MTQPYSIIGLYIVITLSSAAIAQVSPLEAKRQQAAAAQRAAQAAADEQAAAQQRAVTQRATAQKRALESAAEARRKAAERVDAGIERSSTSDLFESGYSDGYRLWETKLYPESRAVLKDILFKFPNHKRASYARNLLGRVWLDEKKPANALLVFYDNYKTEPRGDRAPDSLFFLGSALTDLGKTAEACEAFGELERTYPDAVTSRLAERIASGKTRAKCK